MERKFLITISLFSLMANFAQANGYFYNQGVNYNCHKQDEYTVEEQMVYLAMAPVNRWVYGIFSPLTFIWAGIIVGIFMTNRELFDPQGVIIFQLCLGLMQKSYQEFSIAYYTIAHQEAPNPDGLVCQIGGFFAGEAFIVLNVNLVAFAVYPVIVIRNLLEQSKLIFRVVRFLVFFVMIVALIVAIELTDCISLALSGLCTISPSMQEGIIIASSIYLFTLLTTLFLCLVAWVLFKRSLPKNTQFQRLRGEYLRYYQRFMLLVLILKSLILILNLLAGVNCFSIHNPYIYICTSIACVLEAFLEFGMVAMLSTDPMLRPIFYKRRAKIETSENAKQRKKSISLEEFRKSTAQREGEISFSGRNVFSELRSELRVTQLYSMMAGMLLLEISKSEKCCQYKDLDLDNNQQTSISGNDLTDFLDGTDNFHFTQEEADECMVETLTEEVLQLKLETIPRMQCFKANCVMYSPKIFGNFKKLDQIDFEESFNLLKNKDQLRSHTGPNGGKSGEFFFFSHDNLLIIKTMRIMEVQALRRRMRSYGNYLARNPDSLLSKIYGMYTFVRLDNKAKVHFMVMRNIAREIPRQYISRVYDMKGSEYDREVLAKDPQANLEKTTLKDLDFLKLEQQLWIEEEVQGRLEQQLIKDSNFLAQQKLIDYSLLVMKVDWEAAKGNVLKHLDGQQLNILACTKQAGLYYHLAIIDYLQEWNMNKHVERTTKKLIKFSANLDTSAQEPAYYGKRFQDKLVRKIIGVKQEEE